MNQEQDNINNYNIQNNTFNNTTTTTNIGQSIPSVDLLKSGNSNNLNLNNKPQKKKSFGLIIGIVIVAVVISIVVIFLLNRDANNQIQEENNGTNSQENTNNSNSKDITQLYINYNKVIALTKSGELYGIGRIDGLGKDKDKTNEVTLISKNVKFFDIETATYYLDKNNTLYRAGWNYEGGTLDNFEKTYENVSSFDASSGFCLSVVTKDNQLYINNGLNIGNYCGLNFRTEGFKKIADNVKIPISAYNYHGYIGNDNNLYVSVDGEQYNLIFNNIIDYHIYLSRDLYLDNSKRLYLYEYNYDTEKLESELLLEGVDEIVDSYVNSYGKVIIRKEDNKFYEIDLYNEVKINLIENTDNVKEIYYTKADSKVYLNNNDEIVIDVPGKTPKVLKKDISSMKEIYNFIS